MSKMRLSPRTLVLAVSGSLLIGVAGYQLGARRGGSPQVTIPEGATYTRDGFGGIARTGQAVKAGPKAAASGTGEIKPATPATVVPDPVAPAREAMEKKRYDVAAVEAARTIKSTPLTTPTNRRAVLRARKIEGFALARQGKLQEAQQAFQALADEGAKLPEGNQRPAVARGEWQKPTLREDAHYQHAILTAARGDKAGAEKELNTFIKEFPESPLMIAAVKRISRFHDQNIPKETEKLWRVAMDLRTAKDKEERRKAAMCGPKCLAELLRRQGKPASLETLAKLAKTSELGTDLLALREAARQSGWPGAEGVRLSGTGLKAQKFPLITLIEPGHFVVLEKLEKDGGVVYWDPNREQAEHVPADKWTSLWPGGIALALGGVVKTASR